MTLGTGLGNAVFDNGILAPHVEVSQGPVRWGLTYDDYIGEHERLRLGDAHWSRRVRRVVDAGQGTPGTRFRTEWARVSAPLTARRVGRVLHLGAMAFALGAFIYGRHKLSAFAFTVPVVLST